MRKEKKVKVTILLPEKTIKALDDIAEKELLGSRGRAIQWLVRDAGVEVDEG